MKYYPGFSTFGLFDNWFGESTTTGLMKTDIHEKDGLYELDMEVPGYNKEDIQIELKDGYLKVNATRNTNKEEKDDQGRIIRQERYSGSCSRNFYVGDAISQDDIKAAYENGELKITFPKETPKAIEEPKYIQIQ